MGLCDRLQIPADGDKYALLARIREFSTKQDEDMFQRSHELQEASEMGGDENGREHTMLTSHDAVDEVWEDEYLWLPPLPDEDEDKGRTPQDDALYLEEDDDNVDDDDDVDFDFDANLNQENEPTMTSQERLTSPPPPRDPAVFGPQTVTTFASADRNDLTSLTKGQGTFGIPDTLDESVGAAAVDAPWDRNSPQSPEQRMTRSKQLEEATQQVEELVQHLVASSGAPGFQVKEEEDLISSIGLVKRFKSDEEIPGFDPSKVDPERLAAASTSIRTGRGGVLRDVLRKVESRAVGYDGQSGSSLHYNEVRKIRFFLEGFRKAEVRRVCRETISMLLNKLANDGLAELDFTLATMTRSDDDSSENGGELNDSLIFFLNDIIRKQEHKVEFLSRNSTAVSETQAVELNLNETSGSGDVLETLWSRDEDKDPNTETFDPRNKTSMKILSETYEAERKGLARPNEIPTSAPHQLLALLKLLRERIKAEAAYPSGPDSHGLRILAYCTKMETTEERRTLILREFGRSLEGMEDFEALTKDAVEYCEGTSHELQPSQASSVDLETLQQILELVKSIRIEQLQKARSGKLL
eukprot:Nitzschia sp. Nitz4//scaffold4_size323378//36489//38310//NITZ4_000620-RA/size323378-augustus-gene-0.30-mRNA-1//-1//CDS//3329553279//536//frame0